MNLNINPKDWDTFTAYNTLIKPYLKTARWEQTLLTWSDATFCSAWSGYTLFALSICPVFAVCPNNKGYYVEW